MNRELIKYIVGIFLVLLMITGCTKEQNKDEISNAKELENHEVNIDITEEATEELSENTDISKEEVIIVSDNAGQVKVSVLGYSINENTITFKGVNYNIIEVDGSDTSGTRQSNVAVDVGYGDREYWAFTNEYGQLVYVVAENIVLQDDDTEKVNKDGRYYDNEANVPGTEREDLDQGHVIADSLGGVSNAYNITPQNSTLNRHGNQAYMEKVIRDAKGCQNFVATIIYLDTSTQIPLSYRFEYILKGSAIIDEFDNINPEEDSSISDTSETGEKLEISEGGEVDSIKDIDLDGNGKVTIKEAKAAGFKMPINSSHWLYKYMNDADGDGLVGE